MRHTLPDIRLAIQTPRTTLTAMSLLLVDETLPSISCVLRKRMAVTVFDEGSAITVSATTTAASAIEACADGSLGFPLLVAPRGWGFADVVVGFGVFAAEGAFDGEEGGFGQAGHGVVVFPF